MPLRSVKVHVRPSSLRAYFSAMLPTTLPCASKVTSVSYIAQPHGDAMTMGSIDSPPKSALATRRVPDGAAEELAATGAVVGAGGVVGAGAAAAGALVAAGFG